MGDDETPEADILAQSVADQSFVPAPTTAFSYRQTARRLANRYLRKPDAERGPEPLGVNPAGFIIWLANMRMEWARNTWRQNKSAVVFVFSEAGLIEDAKALKAIGSEGTKRKGTRTSATKRKGFPARDRDRISRWLEARDTSAAHELILWIRATVATGLRPCEWANATFAITPEGSPQLVVVNAKATNGRAHGPTRTINMASYPEDVVQDVQAHSNHCRAVASAGEEAFYHFYTAMRRLMAEASRALWPRRDRHYTLYSLRHQFAANVKQGIVSESDEDTRSTVGALMGHATDDTAGFHYARAAQADSGPRQLVPDAAPEEVARVRRVARSRPADPGMAPAGPSHGPSG